MSGTDSIRASTRTGISLDTLSTKSNDPKGSAFSIVRATMPRRNDS